MRNRNRKTVIPSARAICPGVADNRMNLEGADSACARPAVVAPAMDALLKSEKGLCGRLA
jgi:hypothetical protein